MREDKTHTKREREREREMKDVGAYDRCHKIHAGVYVKTEITTEIIHS